MSMLIAKNIHKSFGKLDVIKGIDVTVEQGEVVAIIGPSGSGKSTFLRCLNKLEKVDKGTIIVDNEIVCENGVYKSDKEIRNTIKKMGMVFQNFNLFPQLSVLQNVIEAPILVNKENREEAINNAKKILDSVGLLSKVDSYPSQLSGGMRQRVALIRTLVTKPEILLLDEAFSALDYQTRLMVTDDVYNIIKNENKTVLMVTHDIPEGISMADRVVVLSKRPAKIQSVHKIEFDNTKSYTPLLRRKDPKFTEYFDVLWKELNVSE